MKLRPLLPARLPSVGRSWIASVLVVVATLLGSGRAAAAPAAVSWRFVVGMLDLEAGLLDIQMTLTGLRGDVRLCLFMDGSERYLRAIARAGSGPPIIADDDCWRLPAAEPQGTTLHYRYDLRGLADRQGQVDYAQRFAESYIWNEQAVLLHPSPLPAHATIEVELKTAAGVPVHTPWPRLPGPGQHFRYDSAQHDGGSYIAVGPLLTDLGPLRFRRPSGEQTVERLVVVDLPHRTSAAALRHWMSEALTAVTGFYGDLISHDGLVLLVPASGRRDPGVFGSALRQVVPSAVIYFGADCESPQLRTDWVATHELFHIGNPLLVRKLHWFTEGFTTYYQDVLRARAGAISAVDGWGDLYDGFRRFCQPSGGRSLADDSQQLYQSYHFTRVYWGGACLAFVTDAAIRARSQGKRSLDDLLRQLRQQSLQRPLDEATILAALDREAGDRLVSRLLFDKRAVAVDDWLRKLGIEPTGPASVRLVDSAPLSAVRRAIF